MIVRDGKNRLQVAEEKPNNTRAVLDVHNLDEGVIVLEVYEAGWTAGINLNKEETKKLRDKLTEFLGE